MSLIWFDWIKCSGVLRTRYLQQLVPLEFARQNFKLFRKCTSQNTKYRNTKKLTASCVAVGGGETEAGDCSPEFDSDSVRSLTARIGLRPSSRATRARQKDFSCSFIVDRRGNRLPQNWQALNWLDFQVYCQTLHWVFLTYQTVSPQCERVRGRGHQFVGWMPYYRIWKEHRLKQGRTKQKVQSDNYLRDYTHRQRKGLSPRWIRSCRNKLPRRLNVRPQREHENGP